MVNGITPFAPQSISQVVSFIYERLLTPKEGQSARIQERQRYVDMIEATEQLHEAKVHLLRQSGKPDVWVNSLAGQVKDGRSNP